jgi:tetratricopeptide (TPR) repeat protein
MFDVMHAHRTISHIAYDKFIVTRDRKIGNTLIELLRQLLEKDDEDQKILHKRILAKILHEYYLSFGDPAAVEEAIAINRHLLDVTPSKPELVEILDVLGASLLNRGKATGNTADLREAVELLAGGLEERAEGQELDADMTTTMSLLATAKRTLAELTKDLVLAHEAVELYRRVIANLPPGDDEYGSTLALLAMSIQIGLYDRKEPGQDMLDEVMQLHKTALELMPTAHIYRPTCLYALAEHYIGLGKMNISTIVSMYPLAIDHMLRALSLMQLEDPQRILIINSLVETQSCLAETTGDYRPLVETTSHTVEEIQNTRRAGTFDYVHVENTTAASLIRRAYLTGDRVPLEDGIRLLRETLVKQPNDVSLLLNLASALHLTHQVSNDLRALQESVVLHCRLDLLISAEHPSRPIFLQNYAAALEACSRIYSVGPGFHEGIMSLLDQALDVLPAGQRPERMKIHTNSGHILLRRYEDLKDPQHLDESAKHHRAALLLRSLTHMDRGLNLHDLACIAEHRAKLTRVDGYVLEAIALYEEALDVEPPGHPLRSSEMYALSRIYANSTYSVFDFHMAVSFLEQALADDDDTAPLSRVLEGIRSLKSIESQYSDEPDQNHPLQRRIFACYKHVVQSLPRAVCSSFTVERRSKTVQLFDATWLGHHAALHAAALAAQGFEDPLLAPELLEQCRSTFWSQALNLRRREFEGVPAHQADELRDLLHVLDAKIDGSSPFFMQHANIMEAENAIATRRRQAARASQLIREIREHFGLERFLMGRTMSEMLRDSKGEVAVLLVGTPAFSQVWVLGQSVVMPVRTLRLHITDQTLKELAAAAYKIDPSRLRGSTGDDDSEHGEPHVRLSMNTRSVEDKHFKRLLSETWLKVVQPIFDAMGLKVSQLVMLLVPQYLLIHHF